MNSNFLLPENYYFCYINKTYLWKSSFYWVDTRGIWLRDTDSFVDLASLFPPELPREIESQGIMGISNDKEIILQLGSSSKHPCRTAGAGSGPLDSKLPSGCLLWLPGTNQDTLLARLICTFVHIKSGNLLFNETKKPLMAGRGK